jgi:hypothetical protein
MDIVRKFDQGHLDYWAEYESRSAIFTAPEELAAGIEPAIGIITETRTPEDLGAPCVRVAWKPTEIDLAHLAQGGTIWLSTWGGLPPHMLEVQAPWPTD